MEIFEAGYGLDSKKRSDRSLSYCKMLSSAITLSDNRIAKKFLTKVSRSLVCSVVYLPFLGVSRRYSFRAKDGRADLCDFRNGEICSRSESAWRLVMQYV